MHDDSEPDSGQDLDEVLETATDNLGDQFLPSASSANQPAAPHHYDSQSGSPSGEEPERGKFQFDQQRNDEDPPFEDEELLGEGDSDEQLASWLDSESIEDVKPFTHLDVRGPASLGDGPVAGGDINYFNLVTQRTTPVAGQVDVTELDSRAATYSKVAAFDGLRDGLSRHRIQVLYGRQGTGRMTTALLALRALGKPVQRIDVRDELRSFLEPGLSGGSGYVIELTGGPDRRQSSVSAGLLDALRDRLRRVDAYLVVVVDTTAELHGLVRSEYIVSCSAPQGMGVFEAHLAQITDNARVRKLREQPDVDTAIRDEVRQASGPAEIVALVEYLAVAVHDDRTVEQIVNGLQSRLRTSVRRWLLGEPLAEAAIGGKVSGPLVFPSLEGETPHPGRTLWDVATLLACCVLNGYPAGRVDAAAELLARRLHDVESPGTLPPRSILRDSVHACDAFICVTEPHEPGSDWFSRWHTPRVRVRDSKMPKVVFEVIWHELSAVRRPFLSWLRNLAESAPNTQLRGYKTRAVDAIGLLAQIDFDHVYRGALRFWASSENKRLNEAAVRALWIASGDERVTSTVRQVLRAWSRADASPRRQRTALLAYATWIGTRFPADALRAVRRIAGAGSKSQATLVFAGLVTGGCADLALTDLAERANTGDTEAMGLFIALAGSSSHADLPDLRVAFLTASTASATQRALVRLWAATLQDPSISAEAWQCLHGWVALADDLPELLAPLGALMDGLMTEPYLLARLPFVLQLWRGNCASPEGASQLLLARVSRT